jgi:hypothetical protein
LYTHDYGVLDGINNGYGQKKLARMRTTPIGKILTHFDHSITVLTSHFSHFIVPGRFS